MFSLAGKKALVTGGSRGIGRGVVLALAEQGADVVINFTSNKNKAEAVAQEVEAKGRKALIIQADVSKRSEVVSMFEQIKQEWGGLDILVNNAGVLRGGEFSEFSEEMLDEVLGVNLKGQFFCAQEAVKMMKNGGRIINIASISSGGMGVGFAQIEAYTASKGGVIGLTENLALDLGPKGINVNAIAPGAIDTDMSRGTSDDKEMGEAVLRRTPKGRVGKPEDIGAAAAFLASDEADYITGVTLYVDGGWLAG
ncbi:SDR family NAD(P)-dependent oxidoreductase [Candidatus Chazhemtobacterium aquaticus]|uniref:Beta-ketoacyl-ACP reductase n=1 Tax=Candidatus Chazhemtobacterium aquaticus TaxID=2715735 RepID=A0A857NHL9_9BACT|nr:3-oxoacyl-ACP reductase family protein [Candidatus Chazhemtobacterium aquaticus]QHO63588.1 beta-ketoacyl-ACP reductase [Candidatus Chazhemtobacterium aquaticus]